MKLSLLKSQLCAGARQGVADYAIVYSTLFLCIEHGWHLRRDYQTIALLRVSVLMNP
jgi:hypothetical protein